MQELPEELVNALASVVQKPVHGQCFPDIVERALPVLATARPDVFQLHQKGTEGLAAVKELSRLSRHPCQATSLLKNCWGPVVSMCRTLLLQMLTALRMSLHNTLTPQLTAPGDLLAGRPNTTSRSFFNSSLTPNLGCNGVILTVYEGLHNHRCCSRSPGRLSLKAVNTDFQWGAV